MVTLYHARTWKITVYGREHGVPHFHIEGRGFRCSIDIVTLELIIGSAPMSVLRSACAWADEHRTELIEKWLELNQ